MTNRWTFNNYPFSIMENLILIIKLKSILVQLYKGKNRNELIIEKIGIKKV